MRIRDISTLIGAALILSAPALAQTYAHAYGGTTVVARDDTRAGFLVGGGAEVKRGYVGADYYTLRPVGDRIPNVDFQGVTLASLRSRGFSAVGGGAVVQTEKLSVIPVGLLGWSRAKGCLLGVCATLTEMNYGGGGIVRIQASEYAGVHLGVRYTVHYGLAFTAGVTFGGF